MPGPHHGRLAQLVRALPSHGRGQRFESSIAHHGHPGSRLGGGSRRRATVRVQRGANLRALDHQAGTGAATRTVFRRLRPGGARSSIDVAEHRLDASGGGSNCSSAPRRPTSWSPNGRAPGSPAIGNVTTGTPPQVHGRFMLASPVLSGREPGPRVDGATSRSTPASAIRSGSCGQSAGTLTATLRIPARRWPDPCRSPKSSVPGRRHDDQPSNVRASGRAHGGRPRSGGFHLVRVIDHGRPTDLVAAPHEPLPHPGHGITGLLLGRRRYGPSMNPSTGSLPPSSAGRQPSHNTSATSAAPRTSTMRSRRWCRRSVTPGYTIDGDASVGRHEPTMPQNEAGRMIDPTVWVPRARGTIPAATAAAEPLLDPPGV